MTFYHVIIAEERRVSTKEAPRELAIKINTDIVTELGKDKDGFPIISVTKQPEQLHTIGSSISNLDNPQIVYAAEWDGVSPYIKVLKGDLKNLKMAYAGWPMVEENIDG